MNKEEATVWKKIEAKGLEKLEKIENALLERKGFEEAHKEYCDFIERVAKAIRVDEWQLDFYFTMVLAREKENCKSQNTTDYMWKENTSGAMTVVGIEKCTSDKCEQGGKRCPMYASCRQKNELRGIL